MLLSIIIPAYNEAERLPRTLDALDEIRGQLPVDLEIIVVVEKSTDDTAAVAGSVAGRIPAVRVVANEMRRGKGFALRTGVDESNGEIVLLMDADLSVPAEYVGRFLEELGRDGSVDVLVGNRQHPGSVIAVRQSWLREGMGKVFNVVVRLVAGIDLRDTQCGFKAFRREAANAIFSRQRLNGFACDVEILLLAERMGFVVRDLPVRWENSPDSRVRLVKDSVRMLMDVIRVRRVVSRTLAEKPCRAGPAV